MTSNTTPPVKAAIFAASLLALASAPAAIVAVDFATDMQTAPTGPFTSLQIPQSVTAGDWQNFSDNWSNYGLELPAGAVSLEAYWDATTTWYNGYAGSPSSPYEGYLDDGSYDDNGSGTGWAIQISGLSDWLSANSSTEWRLVLLRSSDSAPAGFRDVSIHTGTIAELTSVGVLSNPSAAWNTDPISTSTTDNWPAGGTAGTITNGALVTTGAESRTAETNVYIGTSDAFIIRDTGKGNVAGQRGSIAGLILYTVPEPTTSMMAAVTLGGLFLRRRR